MSSAIFKFVDTVTQAQRTGQREIIFKLHDAQALHGEITKLLHALETAQNQNTDSDSVTSVAIDGGSF